MAKETEFSRIKKHCDNGWAKNGERIDMQNEIADAFLLIWDEETKVADVMEGVKITLSPDIRNRILGAVRLLIATDPHFKIPIEINTKATMEVSSKLEEIAKRMFIAAGHVTQEPVHYEAVLSAILFDEVHILITRTQDYLTQTKESDKVEYYRAEQVALGSPYIYDVVDPRKGIPEFDDRGLRSYYRRTDYSLGELSDMFGADKVAKHYKGDADKDRNKSVTLHQYWDFVYRYAWLEGSGEFMLKEEHGLPFLPVTCVLGGANRMFEKEEHQRQPFAYTVWKSKLWHRQNLSLTVGYTNLLKMGASPAVILKEDQSGNVPTVEFDKGLNRWRVPQGGAVEMADLQRMVNPALIELMQLADSKVEESTIYSQTLGEPLGANAPFSMVALLHQAGRLPLLIPQKKAGFAIADAVYKSMIWTNEEPFEAGEYEHIFGADFDFAEIPRHYVLDCILDVALPQDQLQQSNVAKALRGDDALVDRRWIQENLLNIENPEDMETRILDEKAFAIKTENYFAEELYKMEQKKSETANMRMQRMMIEQAIQSGQVPPEMIEQMMAQMGGGQPGAPAGGGGQPGAIPGELGGQGIPDQTRMNPNEAAPGPQGPPPIPTASAPDANNREVA